MLKCQSSVSRCTPTRESEAINDSRNGSGRMNETPAPFAVALFLSVLHTWQKWSEQHRNNDPIILSHLWAQRIRGLLVSRVRAVILLLLLVS